MWSNIHDLNGGIMFIQKIFLLFAALFLTTTLFSQENNKNKVDSFFVKVQNKKIERLKEELSGLDNKTAEKITDVITKYDKMIFKIRKSVIHGRNHNLSCQKRLKNIENQLKIRKKILNLQLKKIEDLKKLNLDCELIGKVVIFERKFMRKLRRKFRKRRHR